MSGLFSRLVARTLHLGPSLSPRLELGPESWTVPIEPRRQRFEPRDLDMLASAEDRPSGNPPSEIVQHPALRADGHKRALGTIPVAAEEDAKRQSAMRPQARSKDGREREPAEAGIHDLRAAALAEDQIHAAAADKAPSPALEVPVARKSTSPAAPRPADGLLGDVPRYSEVAPEDARADRNEARADRAPRLPQLAAPVPRTFLQPLAAAQVPDVQISIGSIEVRAPALPPAAPGPKRRPERPPGVRLADYLAQRRGRGR